MTADRRAALVERVAWAIFGPGGLSGGMRATHMATATAAVDVIWPEALEQAARVVDGMADEMEQNIAWVRSKAFAIRALK